MSYGEFCTSCGECCRHIDRVIENIPKLSREYNIPIEKLDFPYNHLNGVCENLIDNKCSIYDTRPNVCRVDWFLQYVDSKDDFYNLNINACNKLMDENNVAKIYRIKKVLIDK